MSALSKRLLEICRKWASERVQWGVPIGKHYAIAGKVAEMAGNVFAMEAMTFLTSALVDRKAGDLRIETAMCKMWSTGGDPANRRRSHAGPWRSRA